jgi:hypothetical protein
MRVSVVEVLVHDLIMLCTSYSYCKTKRGSSCIEVIPNIQINQNQKS